MQKSKSEVKSSSSSDNEVVRKKDTNYTIKIVSGIILTLFLFFTPLQIWAQSTAENTENRNLSLNAAANQGIQTCALTRFLPTHVVDMNTVTVHAGSVITKTKTVYVEK